MEVKNERLLYRSHGSERPQQPTKVISDDRNIADKGRQQWKARLLQDF